MLQQRKRPRQRYRGVTSSFRNPGNIEEKWLEMVQNAKGTQSLLPGSAIGMGDGDVRLKRGHP